MIKFGFSAPAVTIGNTQNASSGGITKKMKTCAWFATIFAPKFKKRSTIQMTALTIGAVIVVKCLKSRKREILRKFSKKFKINKHYLPWQIRKKSFHKAVDF